MHFMHERKQFFFLKKQFIASNNSEIQYRFIGISISVFFQAKAFKNFLRKITFIKASSLGQLCKLQGSISENPKVPTNFM